MKKLIVTIVLAAFGAVSSFGQSYSGKTFLDPLQPRDSVLIGDQFVYGVHLKEVLSGTVLVPADFSKGFMPAWKSSVRGSRTRLRCMALRRLPVPGTSIFP